MTWPSLSSHSIVIGQLSCQGELHAHVSLLGAGGNHRVLAFNFRAGSCHLNAERPAPQEGTGRFNLGGYGMITQSSQRFVSNATSLDLIVTTVGPSTLSLARISPSSPLSPESR